MQISLKMFFSFVLRAIEDCLCSFWPKPQKEAKSLLGHTFGAIRFLFAGGIK